MIRPLFFLHLEAALKPARRVAALGLLATLALAGCRGLWSTPPTPPPLPAEPTALAEENASQATAEAEALDRQLVVWLPAYSGLAAGDAAAGVLESAFLQYEQNHPSVHIDAFVKAETGPASLFQLLRSAHQVAPTILPDLALINTQQLWQLVDLGLITSLTEAELATYVSPMTDLYPFARAAVTYQGQLYGIPFAADVVHGAFPPATTAPTTWEELLAHPLPFLFPGGYGEGYQPAHTLLQYVAAGGELSEDGSISSPEAVQAYLDFLAEGRELRAIPVEAAELTTFRAVWDAFRDEPAGLASVQTQDYLEAGIAGQPVVQLAYGPVPTRSGEMVTVAETWAFVLLTEDATQRELALALAMTLLAPTVQGPWSQYSGRLPSRSTALAAWTPASDYVAFLDQQLNAAIAIPNGRAFSDFARRLQLAQAAVLRGELTPEQAGRELGITP